MTDIMGALKVSVEIDRLRSELAEAKDRLQRQYTILLEHKSRAERAEASHEQQVIVAANYAARAERAEFEGKNLSHNLREANARIAELEDEVNEECASACKACVELALAIKSAERAEAECRALRAEIVDECYKIALEQRCERGTPWDLACLAIAEAIKARAALNPSPAGDKFMSDDPMMVPFERWKMAEARAARAEAECMALREALEPFAKRADEFDCETMDWLVGVLISDLRKARAALNPSPAEREG